MLVTNLTFDDLLASAQTIAMEARAEPFNGQIGVAEVLINRFLRPRYFRASSIWQVCHAPWQFSAWNNSPDRNLELVMAMPLSHPAIQRGLQAFLIANNEHTQLTKGADHYYARYIPAPKWADRKKFTVQIDTHLFFKLANG